MIWFIIIGVTLYFLAKRAIRGSNLPRSGSYNFDIVGEASYQDALEQLAGGKTEAGVRVQKLATLNGKEQPV